MEIGIDPSIPTYSGGLGILAGDTLHAAADLGIPMVGMTLIYHKDHFEQNLDDKGNQSESTFLWSPQEHLKPLPQRATVEIEGRNVFLRPWTYTVQGISGHEVPIYFLDANLPENDPMDRTLTDYLYGGDIRYRFCQEIILGIGGVAVLQVLGYKDMQAYHMNEGHSSLLALALLELGRSKDSLATVTDADREAIRNKCVFTTHTPVRAGHDQFPRNLVEQILGTERTDGLEAAGCFMDGTLNMTHLGLTCSRYINGVSMRHEEISRGMFPGYPINSVTNGVHAVRWTSETFVRLYDQYIPEWRYDNLYLRYSVNIPVEEIWQAHAQSKENLLAEVESREGVKLDPQVMTIGFARRATGYKRADLLLTDLDRLRKIIHATGPLQVIYSGKAHPRDETGKNIIRSIYEAASAMKGTISIVYLNNYDMTLAKKICSGVDLWLNTPQKPYEASGTSGMKAALNGVPSLSVLDGWWVEGCIEGLTGWAVGGDGQNDNGSSEEIQSLYDKLEHIILPLFYHNRMEYGKVMRSAISINGSYFNAQRMVFQYLTNAYITH
jgi:starch phosphorylase